MAGVTFGGVTRLLQMGGIGGDLSASSSYTSTVKNCVNYGSLTKSGTVNWCSNIGGIVGSLTHPSYPKYIRNCANYAKLYIAV